MTDTTHPHRNGQVVHAGAPLEGAGKVVILLHGRGASAQDIVRLGVGLVEGGNPDEVAFLAPQATNHTWYPVSGYVPQDQLAPWLESALTVIDELIDSATAAGVSAEKIVVGGFSQGAMLSLEYASRGRRTFGGVIAFSGSLIGPTDQPHAPLADVSHLKMFIGCGTNDSWIPNDAAATSARLFQEAGAEVDLRIYEGMDHIINDDEIEGARALVSSI